MPDTTPDRDTRSAERAEAHTPAGADRSPTPDEEAQAEQVQIDPDTAAHYEEMAERGARQKGEGRVG